MRNEILVHVNGKTYMQRIKPTLVGPVIFATFVIAIGYLGTESPWTLVAGLLLFSLYFVERLYWGRIYITDIEELPDEKLKITYLDKNEVKEYIGDKKSFRLQRSSVWYKMKADREQYITLKDEQKGFVLKQFALGDWQESMINQLVDDWQPEMKDSNLAAAS
ncbi:MAG: hypothetical protein JO072_14430 [Parafilimonas sp.]|nr:hypothetical protein [Parafilimonas sp.]